MSIDEKIKKLIQDRIAKLKTHVAKQFFEQNPHYPQQQRLKDMEEIREEIEKLKSIHSQIKEEVKKLKKLIPDITEQTTLCAVYLIYGKVLQTWEAVFLLAERESNFDVIELIRSINENLDLIKAFHLDKEEKYLKRWFEGEIIDNGVSRKLIDEFSKEMTPEFEEKYGLSLYDLSKDVYRTFSKYIHCS